jgi:hypothetical protein
LDSRAIGICYCLFCSESFIHPPFETWLLPRDPRVNDGEPRVRHETTDNRKLSAVSGCPAMSRLCPHSDVGLSDGRLAKLLPQGLFEYAGGQGRRLSDLAILRLSRDQIMKHSTHNTLSEPAFLALYYLFTRIVSNLEKERELLHMSCSDTTGTESNVTFSKAKKFQTTNFLSLVTRQPNYKKGSFFFILIILLLSFKRPVLHGSSKFPRHNLSKGGEPEP